MGFSGFQYQPDSTGLRWGLAEIPYGVLPTQSPLGSRRQSRLLGEYLFLEGRLKSWPCPKARNGVLRKAAGPKSLLWSVLMCARAAGKQPRLSLPWQGTVLWLGGQAHGTRLCFVPKEGSKRLWESALQICVTSSSPSVQIAGPNTWLMWTIFT